MKTNLLKPTGTFAGALLLTLLLGCGPSKPAAPETKDAATGAPPTSVAEPATPAAPTETPQAATPAGAIRYDAQPTGSKVKIAGTSTMHDWTMESSIVSGFLEGDAKFPESALTDPGAARPTVQVSIPVRSLKSNSKKMDSVMQENMREPEFKKIEYRLLELKPKSAAGASGALQFDAVGALTITGTTVTNTMPVTIEKTDGKLKVIGSTPIKFTEYKMKPPEIKILGMSAISVGDDLKITFEWLLAPKSP